MEGRGAVLALQVDVTARSHQVLHHRRVPIERRCREGEGRRQQRGSTP